MCKCANEKVVQSAVVQSCSPAVVQYRSRGLHVQLYIGRGISRLHLPQQQANSLQPTSSPSRRHRPASVFLLPQPIPD